MLPVYWSYILALTGAVGTILIIVDRVVLGAWIGLCNQILWGAYAVVSKQDGFWFSVGLYGLVNIFALRRYYKRSKQRDRDWERQ